MDTDPKSRPPLPWGQFLFIDIDDTLVQARPGAVVPAAESLYGQTLLLAMRDFAIDGGMPADRAETIIHETHQSIRWWHWTDYLRGLQLDAAAFWDYAYRRECVYFQPTSGELPRIFRQLDLIGFRMMITSNNPSSGILHKLRLAGLGEIWGCPWFVQYLGASELRCMKSESEYWQRVLARTGIRPADATVIGDSWQDDVLAPRQAGIRSAIYLDPDCSEPTRVEPEVWRVGTWPDIAQLLSTPKGTHCASLQKWPT